MIPPVNLIALKSSPAFRWTVGVGAGSGFHFRWRRRDLRTCAFGGSQRRICDIGLDKFDSQ